MSNLAQAGVPFSVTLSAPVSGSLTWSTTSTATQHGITFTGGSTGVVAGTTPTVGTGTWAVKWVSASGFSYTGTVTVVIGSATSITVTPLTFNVNESATQQLDAIAHFSNSTAADVSSLGSWSCASGAGCTGTTISSSGLLTAGTTPGTANIQITFGGQIGTATGTVQSAAPSLSITSTNPLPKAQINQPYSEAAQGTNGSLGPGLGVNILVTGGTPPYTCSISSGSLPTGIALSTGTSSPNINCFISGTPTTAAAGSSFTIHVVDAASGTANLVATAGIPAASLSSLVVNLANANLTPNTSTQATAVGTYSDSSTATLPNSTGGSGQPYNTQSPLASSTTSVASSAVATTTGDLVVVVLNSYTSAHLCTAYTDSVTSPNETFTAVSAAIGESATPPPYYNCIHEYYAPNITGASDVVTCGWSVTISGTCTIQYYHNMLASPLDLHPAPTQAASVAQCATGSQTTTAANEVAVFYCAPNSATGGITPPSGYTAEFASTGATLPSFSYMDVVYNAIQTGITPTASFSPGAQPESLIFSTFKSNAPSAGGVVWSSGTPACATVSNTGLVTAQPATVTCTSAITGTVGAVSNSSTVTVTVSNTDTGVLISPTSATVSASGGTQQFTAVGNVTGNGYAAQWTSSNTAVATINTSSGLATCSAVGSVNISAAVSGFGPPSPVPMNCANSLTAGIISSPRAINWATTGAGVVGGIPSASYTQCGATVAPIGSTSSAASPSGINSAIAACPANTYLQLGAGTFYLNGGLLVSYPVNHFEIRGMGANQTFLVFTGTNACNGWYADACFLDSGNNSIYNINNGPVAVTASSFAQGSATISLASVPNLKVGNPIYIDQLDDTQDIGSMLEISETTATFPYTSPGSPGPYMIQAAGENNRTNRSQIQITTVTQCDGVTTIGHACSSGANITISPGFIDPNWTSAKSPQAWWPTGPIEYVGLKDVSIDSTNDGSPGTLSGSITFYNADNGWVTGVRTIATNRSAVWTISTQHMTVRENYFFLARNSTSTSYGYECYAGADALVESNIFQAIAGPLTINGACLDIVLDYNYATTAFYTSSSGWSIPTSNLHGSDTDFDLYEGNVSAQLAADLFHGPHNMDTFFRNQVNGSYPQCWQSGSTWPTSTYGACTGNLGAFQFLSFSRFFNVIGNVILGTGYTSGSSPVYFNLAQGESPSPADPATASSLMRWGNWDSATNATRWCGNSSDTGWATTCGSTSEIPTGYMFFPNTVPTLGDTGIGQGALPASFYYASKPSWWPSGKPWPLIGPDVTGGNISGTAGHANTNPAEDCFINVMGGSTNGGTGPFTFSRATCYPGG